VATSLAHDGIASPVSVLERDGISISYGVHIPLITVVDLDFVRRSPARQTRSGIGDALSNLSAVADWELAHEHTGEPLDGLAVALARTGAEALLTHPGGIDDDEFLVTLANALLLGGVAMAVAGSSRPCSGGCHEISHAISRLHPQLGTHGEQVALGALFCSWLRGSPRLDDLVAAYVRHGLPRVPADLGLSAEQFVAAVLLAPRTRPGRYTILEHLRLDESATRDRVGDFIHAMADHAVPSVTPVHTATVLSDLSMGDALAACKAEVSE
jgi:glycerol-1-phosphate dehydrogenase [NAD(P)+]